MKENLQNSAKKDQKSVGFRTALYIQIPKLDDKLKELTEGAENLKLNSNFITPTITPRTSDPKTFEFLKDCISSDLLRRLEESSPIKCSTPVLQRRISELFLVNCDQDENEAQILSDEKKEKNVESEKTSKNQSPEVNFDEKTLNLKKFTHSKKNFLPKFSTIENPNFSPSFFKKNEDLVHPAIPLNINLNKCDSPKFKSIKYADSTSSPIYNYYNDTSEYFSQFFSGDYNKFNKIEKTKNTFFNQIQMDNFENSEIINDNSNYFHYNNYNSREENNPNYNQDYNNKDNFDFNFTNKAQNLIINNSLEKNNNTSDGMEYDHNLKFQIFNKLPLKENFIKNENLQENQNKIRNIGKSLDNFNYNMNREGYNIKESEKIMEIGFGEHKLSHPYLIEESPNEKFLNLNPNQNQMNQENQNNNFFNKIILHNDDEYPTQTISFNNNIKNFEMINQNGNFLNYNNINENECYNPHFSNNINFSFGNKNMQFFKGTNNINGSFNVEDPNILNNDEINNMQLNIQNLDFNNNNDQVKNQFWQKNFGKNKAVNIEKINNAIPNLNSQIKKANNCMFNQNNNHSSKFDPEDYIVEMFGKRGWICQACNNFNYETRSKCNRCGIPKIPKKITNKKNKFNLNNSNFENGIMQNKLNETISTLNNNINNSNANNSLNYKIKSNFNNLLNKTVSNNSQSIHNSEVNINKNNTAFSHNSKTDNLNGSVISNDKVNKKQLVERLGDWDCFRCKNLNFSFRNVCNRCHLDKIESDNLNKEFSINYANYLRFNEMIQNRILMNHPMNYFQNGNINNNSMNINNIYPNSIQTENRFPQGIPQNINYYNNFFGNANINITPMNPQQPFFNGNQEPNYNNSKFYNEEKNYYGNESDYNGLDNQQEI